MLQYTKAIAGGIFLFTLVLKRQFGFDLTGGEDAILEIVMAAGGVYSIYKLRNKSAA